MIFVTVGTQLPFDRLVRGADAWAAEHPEMPVYAQTGRIDRDGYRPLHMETAETLDPESFDRFCREARLIVAHAGTGSLLKAAQCGTPILILPRRASMGEHRNDHQRATAEHFRGRPGIHIVEEESAIGPMIDTLLAGNPEPPQFGPAADPALISTLRNVIFPGSPDLP